MPELSGGGGGSNLPDPVTVAHGGTGATDAAGARTALELGTAAVEAAASFAHALGADDNYVTDAEKTVIGNTSGANTGDQTSLPVTAAPGSDVTGSGIKITLTAAVNVAFGDVCYIDANGKAALVDADAIATASGVVMALASISADGSGSFLLFGVARNDAWTWTVGGLIYITVTGTTGNTLSQTAPSGTNDVIQIVGVATHADRMLFMPNLVQIEHV